MSLSVNNSFNKPPHFFDIKPTDRPDDDWPARYIGKSTSLPKQLYVQIGPVIDCNLLTSLIITFET